jgi:hypothetical protein
VFFRKSIKHHIAIMKNFAITGTAIAATLLLSACDPQPARTTKPARGPAPSTETEKPKEKVKSTPKAPKKEKKEEPKIDSGEPTVSSTPEPKGDSKPVPAPNPNPEYGQKSAKPGYIESPHAPGKMIDVRGLPPGTEIEDPYSRRPLLVP